MSDKNTQRASWFCPVCKGACAGEECMMWTGGTSEGCGIAKIAAVLSEIENRLYETRQDLRGGLRDIAVEVEAK